MRRRAAKKRPVSKDPKFKSVRLSKFIQCIMYSGKKTLAQSIVYKALDVVLDKEKADPDTKLLDAKMDDLTNALHLFESAIESISPMIEVRSRRVGGATYQVPVEVPANRRSALAYRWLIAAARKRSGKSMALRLGAELHDALKQRGEAFKKKEDMHRMAKANQAFAHIRV